jgi:hypothetical protein
MSIESGIILRVIKSHAAHISSKSEKDGHPKGVLVKAVGRNEENEKGGRSTSQSEYPVSGSVQRLMGRSSASVKRVHTSSSENYKT